MVKVVAFLPAKGSSERIKNKNIQLLDSKPLFLHTLEKLLPIWKNKKDFKDFMIKVHRKKNAKGVKSQKP